MVSRAAGIRRCDRRRDPPRLFHPHPVPGRQPRGGPLDQRRQPRLDPRPQPDPLQAVRPPASERVPVLARNQIRCVRDHRGHEVAQVQTGREAQVQPEHQHDREPAAAPHQERRQQQQRQRRLGQQRPVGQPARQRGRHPVPEPDGEPGGQAIQMDRVVNGAAAAPAGPLLVDGVEEVAERELCEYGEHAQRNEGLRAAAGGAKKSRRRFRWRRAPAGEDRVDREEPARRKKRRPQRQQTEHHVAAVVEQQRAAVQAEHADERQDLRQLGTEPDEQAQVDDQADDEAEHRLVPVRRQIEQREDVVPGRTPEQRVVRNDPVVRVPDTQLGPAAEKVAQQHQRQHDAPR